MKSTQELTPPVILDDLFLDSMSDRKLLYFVQSNYLLNLGQNPTYPGYYFDVDDENKVVQGNSPFPANNSVTGYSTVKIEAADGGFKYLRKIHHADSKERQENFSYDEELLAGKAETFSYLYPFINKQMMENGTVVPSRNGTTREFLNFKTIITDPTRRCVGGFNRNVNIFFLLAEAIWIVNGREDVAWLEIFNKQMREYSDNGKTFHAPYGHRIRFAENSDGNGRYSDQLAKALNLLQENPSDRRVVISIWNHSLDLAKISKDIPCISGDMKFFSPEGNLTIREVYRKLKSNELDYYPVYSYDENRDLVVLRKLRNVTYSGKKMTLKVCLADGTELRITEDHLVYRRIKKMDGKSVIKGSSSFEIVYASELKVGQTLLSDVISLTPKGHKCHKRRLFENTNYDNSVTVHRQYYKYIYGEIEEGCDIHHIDRDKFNNSILNLEELPQLDHAREHAQEMAGDSNPTNRESIIARRVRLFKRRAALRKNNWNVPHHEDDDNIEELEESLRLEKLAKKQLSEPKLRRSARIVSIEEYGVEGVYDFNLKGTHNALFENGVVVHNCNDMLMFKVRDGKLYQTIQNRSNDLHWGLPTNVFQFSFLGEVMASILGLKLGDQVHNSQSLHVYTDNPIADKMYQAYQQPETENLYDVADGGTIPMDFKWPSAVETPTERLAYLDDMLNDIMGMVTLVQKNSYHNSKEDYVRNIRRFSNFLAYLTDLLIIYVDYTTSNRKDNDRITAVRRITELRKVTEYKSYNTDLEMLAINFFVQRLKAPHDIQTVNSNYGTL